MTFVAAYSGSRSAPVVWAAGDVLVAVAMDASSATLPSDWTLQWSSTLMQQLRPGFYDVSWVKVWTRRMGSAGSGVVALAGVLEVDDPSLWVGRYSGVHVRATVDRRVQAERPVWLGSPEVAAGDVVHVGMLTTPAVPDGDTSRLGNVRYVVSDRVTSGVVAAATATGAARTDGATLTVHLATQPLVPTPVLTQPSVAGVDSALPVPVAWDPIAGQTAYAIRRTSSAGVQSYWTGSAWQSTATTVTSSASSTSVSLPGGDWSLAVQVSVGSAVSAWSASVVVTAATAPAAPMVTVSSWVVRRPVVTVSGSAGAGAVLAGYQIEVWSGAAGTGELVESALDLDGSWQPTGLPDGAVTIRAAVVQNGDQRGPWTTTSGTVAVPPVPAPTVEAAVQYLSATVEPGADHTTGLPGVRLSIATSIPGPVRIEVSRDGLVWVAGEMTGAKQLDDYSPGGDYRVRVGDLSRDPVEWSAWVPVTLPVVDQRYWIVPPQAPELAVKTTSHSYDDLAPDLRSSVVSWIDSPEEHVTYGVAVNGRRHVQVGVWSRWSWDRLVEVLKSGLLLRMQWYDSTDGTPMPTDRFRVARFDSARWIPTRNIDAWSVEFDIIPQTED